MHILDSVQENVLINKKEQGFVRIWFDDSRFCIGLRETWKGIFGQCETHERDAGVELSYIVYDKVR